MWEREFIGKEKSGISLNTASPTACCKLKNPSHNASV